MNLLLGKEAAIHEYHYESRWAREAVEGLPSGQPFFKADAATGAAQDRCSEK